MSSQTRGAMTVTERLVRSALELHRLAMVAREAGSDDAQDPASVALNAALNRADAAASECAPEIDSYAGDLRKAITAAVPSDKEAG